MSPLKLRLRSGKGRFEGEPVEERRTPGGGRHQDHRSARAPIRRRRASELRRLRHVRHARRVPRLHLMQPGVRRAGEAEAEGAGAKGEGAGGAEAAQGGQKEGGGGEEEEAAGGGAGTAGEV